MMTSQKGGCGMEEARGVEGWDVLLTHTMSNRLLYSREGGQRRRDYCMRGA